MHAIRFHEYGPPEFLRWEDIPQPIPGDGEVLIRIHSAGVNPIDTKYRAGLLQKLRPITLPFIPGSDMSGMLEAVGPRVVEFTPGQAVFGLARGSYAEFALTTVSEICAIPASLSFEQAATIPLGVLTAWRALEDAGVHEGHRVLVQGAAGGVGLFVVQLAKLRGATVLGTCSGGNIAYVQSLGAEALDYTLSPDLRWNDLDVIIDTVGGRVLQQSMQAVRPGGTVISLAEPVDTATVPPTISARFVRRGSASGLARFLPWLEKGQLVPHVRAIYPMGQASVAHRVCEEGHGAGRIVLSV